MRESITRRLRRSAISLHRTDMLGPVMGLAALSASATAMAAVAQAFPDAGLAGDGFGMCNPLGSDLGCGHGFGCACHMLPEPHQIR